MAEAIPVETRDGLTWPNSGSRDPLSKDSDIALMTVRRGLQRKRPRICLGLVTVVTRPYSDRVVSLFPKC